MLQYCAAYLEWLRFVVGFESLDVATVEVCLRRDVLMSVMMEQPMQADVTCLLLQ